MLNSIQVEKIIQYTGHNSSIYTITDKKDSPYFYTAGGDGWIVQWQKDGKLADGLLLAKTEGKIYTIAMDETKNLMVAGDMNGHIYWIDMSSKQIISRILHHKGSIFDFHISEDYLYSVGADGYLCRWDLNSKYPLESVRISHQGLRSIVFDKNRNVFYIGASDNAIYIVESVALKTINKIENAHENSVFCLAILEHDTMISGGRDANLQIRNLENMELRKSISAHWYTINRMVHLPELDLLATASRDKTIRLWDTTNFELVKSIDFQKGGHINSVNDLLWLPEQQTLISVSDDRTAILWDIKKI